jgi:hypothetical protein
MALLTMLKLGFQICSKLLDLQHPGSDQFKRMIAVGKPCMKISGVYQSGKSHLTLLVQVIISRKTNCIAVYTAGHLD